MLNSIREIQSEKFRNCRKNNLVSSTNKMQKGEIRNLQIKRFVK